MQRIISVIGKPNAGKGIRLRRFIKGKENEYRIISLGNILRKEIQRESELGELIKDYVEKAKLVPNYIVTNLVLEEIKSTSQDIILDGYPRNIQQAEDIMEYGANLSRIIEVEVSEEKALARAAERLVCAECGKTHTIHNYYEKPKKTGICNSCGGKLLRREDDDEKSMRKRISEYEKNTKPMLEYLRKCRVDIIKINGEIIDEDAGFESAICN